MKKFGLAILFLIAQVIWLAAPLSAQYDKDVFFLRGRQAFSDGKYALAIENFNVLARLDTTDYWNFFFRGISKYNLGDIRGAQQDFDRTIRLNPIFTNGYHYRGITKSRQGQYEEGLEDINKAISLRPGFSGLYYSRGVTYFLARRFDEAIADFDRYIKNEPKDPGAYLNRGACYLFSKDTTKALEDYNKAIGLDRYDPEAYIRRGRVFASRQDYDHAIEDLDHAIQLDTSNTFAYFNRALMYADCNEPKKAMEDLDRVLKDEPGNALTLYNRSLLRAQLGDYEGALDDMDRVIGINPGNVLAYFNRAGYFIEMNRWQDALEDYNMSIALYPDFAKAYMNRSYVEKMMGRNKASKADYEIARKKVAEYNSKSASGQADFADTTKKYSSLLALDADFAKKDFENELLQHRDIDIRLRPLYKFDIAGDGEGRQMVLRTVYENPLIDRFLASVPIPVAVTNEDVGKIKLSRSINSILAGDSSQGAGESHLTPSAKSFIKGIYEVQNKQYNSALACFDQAAKLAEDDVVQDRYAKFYKAFYLMNRGVLRAEMIDFIASMERNVRTLTMDDQGTIRARISDRVDRSYDYSEAIADIQEAMRILPDIPYLYFNMGNLQCLSGNMVEAIENYDRAIRISPEMGDAYFNRALALIFIKDKEKGCIDLSRAGELGVTDAYGVISKYCKEDDQQ
ncbi:MAG: tetratricopeptide repeat protein [Bacteroidales bacterium]|nr:tetratricopeptide repeat protein [Bacteroidales bacterium]